MLLSFSGPAVTITAPQGDPVFVSLELNESCWPSLELDHFHIFWLFISSPVTPKNILFINAEKGVSAERSKDYFCT